MTKPILGYWNIRGLGEICRLTLKYAKVDYEEKVYDFKVLEDGKFDASEWFGTKSKAGLDIPNLPWIKDDDVYISQSGAVAAHIARKYCPELLGKTIAESAKVDQLISYLVEFNGGEYRQLTYMSKDLEADKVKFIGGPLKNFMRTVGGLFKTPEQKFATGDEVRLCDFFLVHKLNELRCLVPGKVEENPALVAYIERFNALPNLAEYIASSEYKSKKFNAPPATWNGTLE